MITFEHGVAAGDPASDGAILWTRALASDGFALDLECVVAEHAEDGVPGSEVLRIPVRTDPDRDHTVHVTVTGLQSGRRYRYWFEQGVSCSRSGFFRTLPASAKQMRIGVASCAKYNAGHFNAYAHLATQPDLAFVLHLGDYIYEAANKPPRSQTPGAAIGRDFDPPHECRTLADYRRRYAQHRKDEALQALHAEHAIVSTLDDHELADNAWSQGSSEHRPDEHGPWSERVRAALTAWKEWIPSRVRSPQDGDPVYRTIDLGDLGVIALTEARTSRSGPDAPADSRTALGFEQRNWLKREAGKAEGTWFVLGSPSALAPFWRDDLDPVLKDVLRTLKIGDPDGDGPNIDGWDAFEAERDVVFEMLGASSASCLVLSGDIHIAVASDLVRVDTTVATEWVTASVTSQNLDDKRGWARRTSSVEYETALLGSLENLRYCNFDDHGYMVVTLAEDRATAEWWFVDSVREAEAPARLVHTEVKLACRESTPVADQSESSVHGDVGMRPSGVNR